MDLINTFESEWQKKFPGEPLPSDISREKKYDGPSLQNAIKKCEQTINELENKLKKELFLRDFLQDVVKKLPATDSQSKTANASIPDFPQKKNSSKPSIASLLAEQTVSISTTVLNEPKKTPKETIPTNLKTQSEEPEKDVDDSILKPSNMKDKISDIEDKKDNTSLHGVNMNANSQTGPHNNQEHFPKPELREKPHLTNQQRMKSFSINSTQQKQKLFELRPTESLRKATPPSIPPKPKKRHVANVMSCPLADTMSHNNIKINDLEKKNVNASIDPQINLCGQSAALPSDRAFNNEVGNCSGICATDMTTGRVKSGATDVEGSGGGKQVAAVRLKHRLILSSTEAASPTFADDNNDDVQPSESLTNSVVTATGSSDDNNNKETKKGVPAFNRSDAVQSADLKEKDQSQQPQSTLFAEKEKPGERSVIKDQANKNTSKSPLPTKRSSLSNNFEHEDLPQHKSDRPSSPLPQTISNQSREETKQLPKGNDNKDREEERKQNASDSQVSLVNKDQLQTQEKLNNEEEAALKKDLYTRPPSVTGGSDQESTEHPHPHTDMSTSKKHKDDICFVGFRKLDTDFYESSLNNNSTLPIPERRSSIFKAETENHENALQKTNVSSSSSAINSSLKTVDNRGEKEDTKENNDFQSDVKTTNEESPIDSSSLAEEEPLVLKEEPLVLKEAQPLLLNTKGNLDAINRGISQESEEKAAEDSCIEVKRNEIGEYKTCIELTDDDDDEDEEESDSSEKKMLKDVTNRNQQSLSNSEQDTDEENEQFVSEEDENLLKMRKQAVRQFLLTEEGFVESLENVQKLMDLFSATIDSKESLLSKTDFEVIFFKISEILSLHQACVKELTPKVQNWQNNETVGLPLKELMFHFPIFEEYTRNYPLAVETINKYSQINNVFKKIAEEASFNKEMQSSLSVLLHKPISQLQFNTASIQEILHYTPKNHPDYTMIESTWRITQHNLTAITNKSDEDKVENEHYLLKSDYLVELVGNMRKLRCFFLFNHVLVCTKEKFWQKGSFDVKWFIPIHQLLLDTNSENDEVKYHSTETVDEIKRKISCIEAELRKDNDKDKLSERAREKLIKKLSELQRELARLSGYLEFVLKHNKKAYTLLMSTDYAREEWKESICCLKSKCIMDKSFTTSEVQQLISNCKKVPNISNLSNHQHTDKMEEHGFVGSLCVTLHELTGLDEHCTTYCCLELDSCGQFFTKAHSKPCNDARPVWNEEFELELDYSHTLRILCYKKGKDNHGDILLGKSALALSKDWLSNFTRKTISMNKISLVISINHLPPNKTIQRIPSKVKTGTFGVDIQKIAHHQNRPFPVIVSICTQEIEKRGLHEVGIYRVSGGQSDIKRLKHAFEKNSIRARKMIADPDFNIHVVAAIFKLFFRELPEPLFTNALHKKFLALNEIYNKDVKEQKLITLIHSLPDANYHTLIHLLCHLQRISENSAINKMTNSNLAMMFGQSLLQPAVSSDPNSVEMASFSNVHLQNDVLEYMMNLQCSGVRLAK